MDPTKKELYTAKRSSGLDTSDIKVTNAIKELKSDENKTNWIIFTVDSNKLLLRIQGSSGFAELKSFLSEDEVYFICIKCTISGKVKFFNVYFVGEQVGGMKKGKCSMYKSIIFAQTESHGEVSFSSGLIDFQEQSLIAELSRLTGNPISEILLY
jgi:hypothetical protein